MRLYLATIAALGFVVSPFLSGVAQTPAPVLIQANTPAPVVAAAPEAAAPAPAVPVADSSATTLQQLQEMRAVNAETIKKQEAALATLDELQKAAEEVKIYSKRG
ncbi:hypothetical protein BH20VER3_BH20VER3_02390 [soil metagenome]